MSEYNTGLYPHFDRSSFSRLPQIPSTEHMKKASMRLKKTGKTKKCNRGQAISQRSLPDDEVFLQPWFVPKKTFLTMRSLLPNCHLMKFKFYFQDYGCLRCGRHDQIYGSNALCERCNHIIRWRLISCLRRRFKKIGVTLADGPIESYLRLPVKNVRKIRVPLSAKA